MILPNVRLGLVLALCVAGCAINPVTDRTQFAADSARNSFEIFDRRLTSPDALVLPLVHDRQYAGPSCGAHALASIVSYWRTAERATGDAIYRAYPPEAPSGYSMSELLGLARTYGLEASAVRLDREQIVSELERGRPVLVPVRLPSIYVQQRVLPGGETPLIGIARNTLIYRAGRVSEATGAAVVNHYLVVVGYDHERMVVIDPVMGYRTISYEKLERYRRAFGDAAIVFSAAPAAATPANLRQR